MNFYLNCVYGDQHLTIIKDVLIPSIAHSTPARVELSLLHYADGSNWKEQEIFGYKNVIVKNIIPPNNRARGFAENHNILFNSLQKSQYFSIINPDCILGEGALESLFLRMSGDKKIAIVEGRQWPFEHPKEYDMLTLETPWASGAFCMIRSDFYREIGGMDELYHMYLEDVDLSWQAWLRGYSVVYEPNATVIHFSGGSHYRPEQWVLEEIYGASNFLLIALKFKGEIGLQNALNELRKSVAPSLFTEACEMFKKKSQKIRSAPPINHPMIKILGYNRFHEYKKS